MTLFCLILQIHYWQLFCDCIEYLCVFTCISLHLCKALLLHALCCIATCFFVVVLHFSLMTPLFHFISLDTLLTTFCDCIECVRICHLNQVQSKTMTKYTEGLATKFKPMETVLVPAPAPTPTRNAWNRTPKFKFNQESFPGLRSPSHIHTVKKQCHSPDDDDATLHQLEPSQHMAGTAITNGCNELIQQIQDIDPLFQSEEKP